MKISIEKRFNFKKLTSSIVIIIIKTQSDLWGWTPSSSYKAALPGSIPGKSI